VKEAAFVFNGGLGLGLRWRLLPRGSRVRLDLRALYRADMLWSSIHRTNAEEAPSAAPTSAASTSSTVRRSPSAARSDGSRRQNDESPDRRGDPRDSVRFAAWSYLVPLVAGLADAVVAAFALVVAAGLAATVTMSPRMSPRALRRSSFSVWPTVFLSSAW